MVCFYSPLDLRSTRSRVRPADGQRPRPLPWPGPGVTHRYAVDVSVPTTNHGSTEPEPGENTGNAGENTGNATGTDELTALRLELWAARDAAFGAVAEAGTLRARNTELEALIHQLRIEVDRLAYVEKSVAFRVGNAVIGPVRAARRLAR